MFTIWCSLLFKFVFIVKPSIPHDVAVFVMMLSHCSSTMTKGKLHWKWPDVSLNPQNRSPPAMVHHSPNKRRQLYERLLMPGSFMNMGMSVVAPLTSSPRKVCNRSWYLPENPKLVGTLLA